MPYSRVEKFFVMEFFETCGGFTPSTSRISMQSCVVLRWQAAEKCCLKVLKIQQREDPRQIFRPDQNLNFPQNHLILWQISSPSQIKKQFLLAGPGFAAVSFLNTSKFWAGTNLKIWTPSFAEPTLSVRTCVSVWWRWSCFNVSSTLFCMKWVMRCSRTCQCGVVNKSPITSWWLRDRSEYSNSCCWLNQVQCDGFILMDINHMNKTRYGQA